TLQFLSSAFFTFVVGVFIGFGSLLGFRFGFLSAFNSENKAKPRLRLSVLALLSRKRQKELLVHGLSHRVDLLYILHALPKSLYLILLVALVGPFFTSWINHSLPQPLYTFSHYFVTSLSPDGELMVGTDGRNTITVASTMTGKTLYK